jgi:nucleoid DNA-binding protein
MFVKTLVASVLEGDKVTLTNHMTFKRALRAERTHKVPAKKSKDGKVTEAKSVTKKAHYVMTMEVKPALKAKFEALDIDVEAEEAEEEIEAEAEEEIESESE